MRYIVKIGGRLTFHLGVRGILDPKRANFISLTGVRIPDVGLKSRRLAALFALYGHIIPVSYYERVPRHQAATGFAIIIHHLIASWAKFARLF
jgi:hypothetical protein